jgi:hypothetical protein
LEKIFIPIITNFIYHDFSSVFKSVAMHDRYQSGLGGELVFEIRTARTAAKFIIKS